MFWLIKNTSHLVTQQMLEILDFTTEIRFKNKTNFESKVVMKVAIFKTGVSQPRTGRVCQPAVNANTFKKLFVNTLNFQVF